MADLTVMKQRIPSIQQVPNEDVLGERGERVEDPPRNCCSLSNLHSISMQQGDIVIPIVTDEETLALRGRRHTKPGAEPGLEASALAPGSMQYITPLD